MAVWTSLLFTVTRDAYLEFRVGRFDLGNMVQAVWSTTQGRPLETTNGSTGEQIVRLGGHVDPFLVLLTPLWMVWQSPLALALAQVVAVSLGALPVFWLGRRHLGSERIAALLALGYLAYPWVAVTAIASIHPVTFAVPLLLFCIWFLETDRLVPFAACAVLVLSTGELMGLSVAALGIWFALARGQRRARCCDRGRRGGMDVRRRLLRRACVLRRVQPLLRFLRSRRRIARRADPNGLHRSWRHPRGAVRGRTISPTSCG